MLLDLHCHGALGANFGTDEATSRRAAAYHRSQGAYVVASLVSAAPDRLEQQVRVLAPLVADGTILGIHLEGPCLAHDRRGAHDPGALIDPDCALVDRLADAVAEAGAPGAIVHWTFAPELPGAAAFAKALVRHGIRPAIGHTAASAAQVRTAIDLALDAGSGPPLITHLFNGMPPLHHRDAGPVAAALAAAAQGEVIVELIADGVHVAPEVVGMVFDLLGPEHIALVSDAMSATGLGDGNYLLGELAVRVSEGVARLVDGGSIAGSTSSLPTCRDWAITTAGLDAELADQAAHATPAVVLGSRLGLV